MNDLEQIAVAAIARDALSLRSLVQDFLRLNQVANEWPEPDVGDNRIRVAAAALAELLAMRLDQDPPAWTRSVGGLAEPLFLLRSAETMQRLRHQCEIESPPPLKSRGLYAPANFLEFA
jgi:hypothetical protein